MTTTHLCLVVVVQCVLAAPIYAQDVGGQSDRGERGVIALPEVVALTARRTCPNKEDTRARTLWNAARSRYGTDWASKGRGAHVMGVQRESVTAELVGQVDRLRLKPFWTGLKGAARAGKRGELPHPDSIAVEYGYARRAGFPSHEIAIHGFNEWIYPSLHSWDAQHFGMAEFGQLNRLSIANQARGEVLLAFCSTDRSRPAVEGTLLIGADSTFRSASWIFVTPKPKENAGGEVIFAAPRENGMLLPARGTFWRKLAGRKLFDQTSYVFLEWVIGDDASVPAVSYEGIDLR